ncbi:MAG: 1-phosphofructokinase family hexose kinase [Oscillospiraceae bacterium]|jgi:1-phosphofructokinase|nr:1-phosphofructokinase family hexose kinase [Oscillospiraceae bacterium]
MVTTLTLNPCVDWTLSLPRLSPGGLNVVDRARTDVGGKGINVSVVLRELGVETNCLGINYASNGAVLTEKLDGLGIPHDFVTVPGAIRTNIKLMDSATNEMTEINSRGEAVSRESIEAVLKKVSARVGAVLVLSGRTPSGAEDDIYKRCIETVSASGVKVVLDTQGAPLRLAVSAHPFLIKPNLYELQSTFGCASHDMRDIVRACLPIIRRGVGIVCVSMGANGALITDGKKAFYAPPLDARPKGYQGAGDSMVAGICKAVTEDAGLDDMLRFGTAAATASIIREGTQLCRLADYRRYLPQVRVEKVTV